MKTHIPPNESNAVMSESLLLNEIPTPEMSFIPFVISIEPNRTPFTTGLLRRMKGIPSIIPISVMKKMSAPPTLNIKAVASPMDSGKTSETRFLFEKPAMPPSAAVHLLKMENTVSIKSDEP